MRRFSAPLPAPTVDELIQPQAAVHEAPSLEGISEPKPLSPRQRLNALAVLFGGPSTDRYTRSVYSYQNILVGKYTHQNGACGQATLGDTGSQCQFGTPDTRSQSQIETQGPIR